ncbi:MAG: hypothetical protein K5839_06210 [Treponemataceae bacterium]|nr:hypothetical protein [Treponemataceae bacterium]
MKRKIFISALIILTLSICLVGCSSTDPFVGIWSDSAGNTITLNENLSYTATINGEFTSGSYEMYYNTLILTNDTTGEVDAVEWDVRGNVLYLTSGSVLYSLYYAGEPEEN